MTKQIKENKLSILDELMDVGYYQINDNYKIKVYEESNGTFLRLVEIVEYSIASIRNNEVISSPFRGVQTVERVLTDVEYTNMVHAVECFNSVLPLFIERIKEKKVGKEKKGGILDSVNSFKKGFSDGLIEATNFKKKLVNDFDKNLVPYEPIDNDKIYRSNSGKFERNVKSPILDDIFFCEEYNTRFVISLPKNNGLSYLFVDILTKLDDTDLRNFLVEEFSIQLIKRIDKLIYTIDLSLDDKISIYKHRIRLVESKEKL